MRRFIKLAILAVLVAAAGALIYGARNHLPVQIAEKMGIRGGITEIRKHVRPRLRAEFAENGLEFGAPVYIRIFKETSELELWVKGEDQFQLFRTYDICNYSGKLGPKLREGDRQSPEGFYSVSTSSLNPNSSYHLSFNLGFPNAFDQNNARTGSFLMVHGNCVSIGCYAMTDPMIEEIYLAVEEALEGGQSKVAVHAFPFRMTKERLATETDNQWYSFWKQLEPAYTGFEKQRTEPKIKIAERNYEVTL